MVTCVNHRYPDLELKDGKVFILVNNKPTAMDRTLSPNDKISFLLPVGGGIEKTCFKPHQQVSVIPGGGFGAD